MTRSNSKKDGASKTLLALTSAALSLPGISGKAAAAAPVSEASVSYQASLYREKGMDGDKVAGSDRSRYKIKTHQVRVASPLAPNADLAVDLTYETMSGASPWYITPDANGKPIQVMSGASIREERSDVQARVNLFPGQSTVASLIAGYSSEDDYESRNVGVELEKTFDAQQLTLSGGIGYSDDDLEPTEGASARFPTRIDQAEKDNLSAFIGLAWVLDMRTALQTSVSVSDQQGYLSDPYKQAFIVNTTSLVADNRPDDRRQWVWTTRLRHFVPAADAALHVDYRYFDDDWDVESHTLELGWLQNLPGQWRLDTNVRYYSQTQAFFYAPYYFSVRSDALASSDYRLSPYGALSLRLRVVKSLGDWEFSAQWEGYQASADLSLDNVDVENPALVEFNSYSLGFNRVF